MSKNKIGEDSPILKFIYLKIRRRDDVESLTTFEEGEFKVPIDGCINEKNNISRNNIQTHFLQCKKWETLFDWKVKEALLYKNSCPSHQMNPHTYSLVRLFVFHVSSYTFKWSLISSNSKRTFVIIYHTD